MATIVASRYAVLSVDDDDDDDNDRDCDHDLSIKKKKVPNKKLQLTSTSKSQAATSAKSSGNAKKKKKQENTQAQNSKNQKSSSGISLKKKKQPASEQASEQWEEWKQKDAEIVEGNFEQDLSKAIFLSKLDYEEKKDYYESIKKIENEKKVSRKKSQKSQKVISANDVNSIKSKSMKKDLQEKYKTEEPEEETEFFTVLDKDIVNEFSEEHLSDIRKARDLNSPESLTLILYRACIEKRNREVDELKEEIERLNIQLKNVKTRNTKLCQIIANSEMKDKAEILMEVERLQSIRDELSSEVANLHIQLEQERSKVRQLSAKR